MEKNTDWGHEMVLDLLKLNITGYWASGRVKRLAVLICMHCLPLARSSIQLILCWVVQSLSTTPLHQFAVFFKMSCSFSTEAKHQQRAKSIACYCAILSRNIHLTLIFFFPPTLPSCSSFFRDKVMFPLLLPFINIPFHFGRRSS